MAYLPDSAVTTLVIHYSATPIERDFTILDIDEMHRQRGFKEVGYHFFIRKDGTVEKGRDLSQPGRFEQGAHSKGENDESIGICYEGGVRSGAPNVGFDSRTEAQKMSMEALVLELLDRFPSAVVKGHRDMPGAATQCPGFNATAWWDEVTAKRAAQLVYFKSKAQARQSPSQSTTIQAAITQIIAAAGGVWGAITQLDGTTQAVALGGCALIAVAAMWIFRERLQKWANGIR